MCVQVYESSVIYIQFSNFGGFIYRNLAYIVCIVVIRRRSEMSEKAVEMEIETEVAHDDEKESGSSDDNDEEEEGSSSNSSFVPSIKIKRMEGSILISTVVVKDVALTSALFQLLEDEKLDIESESQYRTKTRVAHTVQVKVLEGYDVDALEKKLCAWAGKAAPNETVYIEQDVSSPTH